MLQPLDHRQLGRTLGCSAADLKSSCCRPSSRATCCRVQPASSRCERRSCCGCSWARLALASRWSRARRRSGPALISGLFCSSLEGKGCGSRLRTLATSRGSVSRWLHSSRVLRFSSPGNASRSSRKRQAEHLAAAGLRPVDLPEPSGRPDPRWSALYGMIQPARALVDDAASWQLLSAVPADIDGSAAPGAPALRLWLGTVGIVRFVPMVLLPRLPTL